MPCFVIVKLSNSQKKRILCLDLPFRANPSQDSLFFILLPAPESECLQLFVLVPLSFRNAF